MRETVLTSSVLASPGPPHQQTVPAAEQGHQQLLDDLGLADAHLADLLRHLGVGGGGRMSGLGPDLAQSATWIDHS
jgi:hypothetical protein